ncbi:MAG: hypothetical protein A2047_01945 [Omnitrophica bacterium GWA2_41_15]|nr:MAG: hypothetical protein A2047_01945 [Omnitrophica bacterium GWA2_41_15]
MLSIHEETIRDFSHIVDALRKAHFSLLVIGTKISAKSVEHQSKKIGVITYLYSDIVETIDACIKLCTEGYYGSTAKLLRNCFEGTFVLLKLNTYPELAFDVNADIVKKICKGKKVKESSKIYDSLSISEKQNFEVNLWYDLNRDANRTKIKMFMKFFSPISLINQFSDPEIKDENLGAYHRLSQFSHSSFVGLMHRIKENWVITKPLYNRTYSESNLKDVFKTIVMCTNSVKKIFDDLEFTPEEIIILKDVEKKYNEIV